MAAAGSQSSCRAVMPALVARQWDGKVWKMLNEVQWCGTPGKDVSVKAGEVEDGISQ